MHPEKLNEWVAKEISKAREQVHKEYKPLLNAFKELKFKKECDFEEGLRAGLSQAGHNALLSALEVRQKQLSIALQELRRLSTTDIGANAIVKKIEELA